MVMIAIATMTTIIHHIDIRLSLRLLNPAITTSSTPTSGASIGTTHYHCPSACPCSRLTGTTTTPSIVITGHPLCWWSCVVVDYVHGLCLMLLFVVVVVVTTSSIVPSIVGLLGDGIGW